MSRPPTIAVAGPSPEPLFKFWNLFRTESLPQRVEQWSFTEGHCSRSSLRSRKGNVLNCHDLVPCRASLYVQSGGTTCPHKQNTSEAIEQVWLMLLSMPCYSLCVPPCSPQGAVLQVTTLYRPQGTPLACLLSYSDQCEPSCCLKTLLIYSSWHTLVVLQIPWQTVNQLVQPDITATCYLLSIGYLAMAQESCLDEMVSNPTCAFLFLMLIPFNKLWLDHTCCLCVIFLPTLIGSYSAGFRVGLCVCVCVCLSSESPHHSCSITCQAPWGDAPEGSWVPCPLLPWYMVGSGRGIGGTA